MADEEEGVSGGTRKIKRMQINLQEKVAMINAFDTGSSRPEICTSFGVGASTLATILSAKARILAEYSRHGSSIEGLSRKRCKRTKFDELDAALDNWIVNRRRSKTDQGVTYDELHETAQTLALGMSFTGFKPTSAYLVRIARQSGLNFPLRVEPVDLSCGGTTSAAINISSPESSQDVEIVAYSNQPPATEDRLLPAEPHTSCSQSFGVPTNISSLPRTQLPLLKSAVLESQPTISYPAGQKMFPVLHDTPKPIEKLAPDPSANIQPNMRPSTVNWGLVKLDQLHPTNRNLPSVNREVIHIKDEVVCPADLPSATVAPIMATGLRPPYLYDFAESLVGSKSEHLPLPPASQIMPSASSSSSTRRDPTPALHSVHSIRTAVAPAQSHLAPPHLAPSTGLGSGAGPTTSASSSQSRAMVSDAPSVLDVIGALALLRRFCEARNIDLSPLQQLEMYIARRELEVLSGQPT